MTFTGPIHIESDGGKKSNDITAYVSLKDSENAIRIGKEINTKTCMKSDNKQTKAKIIVKNFGTLELLSFNAKTRATLVYKATIHTREPTVSNGIAFVKSI